MSMQNRKEKQRMEKQTQALIAIVVVVLIGAGLAFAGSQGSAEVGGVPVFALCVGLAFLIQWVAFIPAYLNQTEKFFDLTGSLTYITVVVMGVLLTPDPDARALVLMGVVLIWAARLGSFLFMRIQRAGSDERFDAIKPMFARFLAVWTIQGLWVSFTVGAALAAITSAEQRNLGLFAGLGLLVWGIGFGIEVVADRQKSQFRAQPENKGQFIASGLWAWSRHPNYFGEIVLWLGVAIIAFPVLSGGQLLTLISPLFVAFLLMRVSGVPMLEARADEKWGGQADYEAYKAQTPVLIPKPPTR